MAGWHGERFKDPEVFGTGEFYKCYDSKSNSFVLVKQFTGEGFPSSIKEEISAKKGLDHPNIVKLLDVVEDADTVTIVFEYMNSNLEKFIQNKFESVQHLVKNLLFQILKGVSYSHSHNILHGDMKPANVLMDEDTETIKIGVFGHRKVDSAPSGNSCEMTTIQYNAPEILLRMPQNSTAAEIWSVGCIFAEMVRGMPLFNGGTDSIVLREIIWYLGLPSEEEWDGVRKTCLEVLKMKTIPSGGRFSLKDRIPELKDEGLDLLKRMLCFQPHKRISVSDALKHPYFNDLQQKPSSSTEEIFGNLGEIHDIQSFGSKTAVSLEDIVDTKITEDGSNQGEEDHSHSPAVTMPKASLSREDRAKAKQTFGQLLEDQLREHRHPQQAPVAVVQPPVVVQQLAEVQVPVVVQQLPVVEVQQLAEVQVPVVVQQLPVVEVPVVVQQLPVVEVQQLAEVQVPVVVQQLPVVEVQQHAVAEVQVPVVVQQPALGEGGPRRSGRNSQLPKRFEGFDMTHIK